MKLDIQARIEKLKITSQNKTIDLGNGNTFKFQRVAEKGFRSSMEDEDDVFFSPAEHDADKLGRAMSEAIKDLETRIKKLPYLDAGSSVAMVAITPDLKAVCTDYGDSYVVAYVWDSQTKKVTPHVINTQHCAGSPSELERITKEGGHVTAEIYEGIENELLLPQTKLTDESRQSIEEVKQRCDSSNIPYQISYRVNGDKAIARGVNANNLQSSVPEVKVTDLKSLTKNPNDRLFLAAKCDGMFELNCLTPQVYSSLIEEAINLGKEGLIPDLMRDVALNTNNGLEEDQWGSADNLTIVWSEIPLKGLSKTVYAAVYDGFGGSLVSGFLKSKMPQVVLDNLAKEAEARRVLEAVSSSSSSSQEVESQTALANTSFLSDIRVCGALVIVSTIGLQLLHYMLGNSAQTVGMTHDL